MKLVYAEEIHLDSNGNPDSDYYVAEAHRMRSEMIGCMVSSTLLWIRGLLEKLHVLSPRAPLHS